MRNIMICLLAFVFTNAGAQTPRIKFEALQFYPEGIAFDRASNAFYTGSVRTGAIFRIDSSGANTIFYEDPSLKSSFGMKVDTARNCLWVCTGDPNYSIYSDSTSYKKLIRLIAIDLSNGQKTSDINLSNLYAGKHFLNDLALDSVGNIYLTDSYSPVIYRVDTSGKAIVWSQGEQFKGLDVGLNGIVWHPRGYALVVNNNSGMIYKIEAHSPHTIHTVKVGNFFPGADGILWNEDGDLVLVQNKGVNKIHILKGINNWESAVVKASTATGDRFQHPSTCTIKDGKVYVVNSKLNELEDPGITPSKEFSFQLAKFLPVK